MTEELEDGKGSKMHLAMALGRGISPARWGRANGVHRNTAARWAREPEVVKAAEAYRRQVLDQAIGIMTQKSCWAAGIIAQIAETSTSDSVRLRAARAMFSDMITVSKYSGLEARMTEIEESLDAAGATTVSKDPWRQAPANYGMGAISTAARSEPPSAVAPG